MKRIIKDLTKLHKPSKPVEFITDTGLDTEYGKTVVAAITEVLSVKPELVALSAPQIGLDARVFCIRFNDKIKTFINPIIMKKTEPKFLCEESVSFPNKQFLLIRPTELEVAYYTEEFKYEDNKLLGAAASLFDQLYQFLDGITPMDIGLVSDIKQDGAITEKELADKNFMNEAFKIYSQIVEQKNNIVKQDLMQETAEIQAQYKQLAAAEKVITEQVKLVTPNTDKRLNQAQKNCKKCSSTRKLE